MNAPWEDLLFLALDLTDDQTLVSGLEKDWKRQKLESQPEHGTECTDEGRAYPHDGEDQRTPR
jgi:hypothetical protein